MTRAFRAGGTAGDPGSEPVASPPGCGNAAESPCFRVFCFLLCFFLSSGTAYPGEQLWRFDDLRNGNPWTARNAVVERMPQGYVNIRGSGVFFFISPSNLDLHPDLSCVEFRLRTNSTYAVGYFVARTRSNKTWRKEFRYGIPGSFNVYALRLGELQGFEEKIDTLAFVFGEIESVDIEYVKLFEPSLLQRARMSWRDFWDPGYFRASSINFIDTPYISGVSFSAILYGFLVLSFLMILAFTRRGNGRSAWRAYVLCFVFSGTLFALRMDYAWYVMWRMDSAYLSPKSLEDRISFMEGAGTYDVARRLKTLVPPGEAVRLLVVDAEGKLIAEKLKYYLLPARVSPSGKYILVWMDHGIRFDPEAGTLRRPTGILAENVSLVAALRDDILLYRTE